MAIPVSAFAGVVFGDGIPISFGATVGFQYTLALGRQPPNREENHILC